MPIKTRDEITYPFSTLTIASLKFENGQVISGHTL